MHLSHFESAINPTILQRGQHYFEEGSVLDVNEGKNGRWYARVEGTEEYRVEITLDGDDVLHYDCDCPLRRPVQAYRGRALRHPAGDDR